MCFLNAIVRIGHHLYARRNTQLLLLLLATAGLCSASSGNSKPTTPSGSNFITGLKVGAATFATVAFLKGVIYNRYCRGNETTIDETSIKTHMNNRFQEHRMFYEHCGFTETDLNDMIQHTQAAKSYSPFNHFLFSRWARLRNFYMEPLAVEIGMIKAKQLARQKRLQDEKSPLLHGNYIKAAVKRWNTFWSLV